MNRHFFLLRLVKQIVFSCLVCALNLCRAQRCDEAIFGQVVDLHDNTPLQGVSVTLEENGRQLITTENGKFVFPQLCGKAYTLLLEHPDCMPLTVKVSSPSPILKRFYLEHHLNELQEIIVTDNKKKNSTKTGVESSLSKEQINRFRSQNLGDALAQLSGVSSIKTGNAIVKPVVHGVMGSRLAIVNDGIRLQDHEWGADHAPSIDINGADQVQLIKGANALKFGGDAIGGVLEIIHKKYALKDSLFGTVSSGYNQQGRGVYFLTDLTKTKQGGFYYGGTLSLKNVGDLEHPDYVLSNTGNREEHAKIYFGRNTITQAWEFSYSFFQKEAGILSAAHIGSKGDLGRALRIEVPITILPWTRSLNNPRQWTNHHNLSVNYKKQFNPRFKWDVRYNYQLNNRKEFDIRRGEVKNIPALDLLLQTHDLVANFNKEQNNSFQWNTGISGQFQDNYSDPETGVRRLIPDYIRFKLGAYFVAEYLPSNDFKAEVGLRYDYDHIDSYKFYRQRDWNARNYSDDFAQTILNTTSTGQYYTEQLKKYGNLSASAGLRQFLGSNTYLFVNVGYLTRSPNPAELFSDGLHHANARYELGDLRLVQERAIKTLVSLEKQKGRLNYAFSGYWSSVANYIFLQPVGIRQERSISVIQADYRQVPRAQLYGTDIDLGYAITQELNYTGRASWVKALTGDGTPIVDIPPLNLNNELLYSPNSIPTLRFRLTNEYVSQQKSYPDFNFIDNFIENGEIVTEEVDISSSPPAFHLMHIELTTTLAKDWEIRAGIDNIFNVDYRNYLNRLRYFAGESGRNIRLELTYTF